ncbi:DUF2794 domain-containing protein [bacterium]|nr:DUF2794 domain-containing protein [bacterium]
MRPLRPSGPPPTEPAPIWFSRKELDLILARYGDLVATGQCRDYAIGAYPDRAVFSMHERASEAPTWIVEKRPALARKQGAWSVSNAAGMILKRGHDLAQVLSVFDKRRLRVVD